MARGKNSIEQFDGEGYPEGGSQTLKKKIKATWKIAVAALVLGIVLPIAASAVLGPFVGILYKNDGMVRSNYLGVANSQLLGTPGALGTNTVGVTSFVNSGVQNGVVQTGNLTQQLHAFLSITAFPFAANASDWAKPLILNVQMPLYAVTASAVGIAVQKGDIVNTTGYAGVQPDWANGSGNATALFGSTRTYRVALEPGVGLAISVWRFNMTGNSGFVSPPPTFYVKPNTTDTVRYLSVDVINTFNALDVSETARRYAEYQASIPILQANGIVDAAGNLIADDTFTRHSIPDAYMFGRFNAGSLWMNAFLWSSVNSIRVINYDGSLLQAF